MPAFCGVLLHEGVDPAIGKRIVASMLSGYGLGHHQTSEIAPATGLCLGFTTPNVFAAREDPDNHCVVSQGRATFGTAMLWDREAIAQGDHNLGDLSLVHRHLERRSDMARINGDFSIGLYEEAPRQVTFWRDQVGVQTLVYAQHDLGMVFANNARFLCGAFTTGLSADPVSLATFVLLRHPGAARFYTSDVTELQPAHSVKITSKDVSDQRRYWSLGTSKSHGYRTREDCVEHVKETFVRAVRSRIETAARPAISLSGGLDSSAIAGVMGHLKDNLTILGLGHLSDGPEPIAEGYDDRRHMKAMDDYLPNLEMNYVRSDHLSLLLGPSEAFGRGLMASSGANSAGDTAMEQQALDLGADVLLDGYYGDVFLSYAGRTVLTDAIYSGRFGLVAQEIRRRKPQSFAQFRRLIQNAAIAPLVPKNLRARLRRGRGTHWTQTIPLARDWQKNAEFLAAISAEQMEHLGNPPRSTKDEMERALGGFAPQVLMFRDVFDKDSGFQRRFPMLDVDLITSVYWTPSEHHVTPNSTRQLIRDVSAPFMPQKIRNRIGKDPFMRNFQSRLQHAVPEMRATIESAMDDPTWEAVFDRDKITKIVRTTDVWLSPEWPGEKSVVEVMVRLFLPFAVSRFLELLNEHNSSFKR